MAGTGAAPRARLAGSARPRPLAHPVARAIGRPGTAAYYTALGEATGRWLGAAVGELEIAGRVEGDALIRALNGNNPSSGDPLVERRGGTRVPGFDLTFSAPKSVSVLFGLGDSQV